MSRNILKITVLALLMISLMVSTSLGQTRRKRPAPKLNQPNNVEISKDLLQQLMRDDAEVRNFVNQGLDNDAAQKFTADLVDLNGDGKTEFIVLPPNMMMGNSSGPTWIYRRTVNGYKLLLHAAQNGYKVLKPSTNGYRELEMSYGGSMGYDTDTYMYNGTKYVLKSTKHRN